MFSAMLKTTRSLGALRNQWSIYIDFLTHLPEFIFSISILYNKISFPPDCIIIFFNPYAKSKSTWWSVELDSYSTPLRHHKTLQPFHPFSASVQESSYYYSIPPPQQSVSILCPLSMSRNHWPAFIPPLHLGYYFWGWGKGHTNAQSQLYIKFCH